MDPEQETPQEGGQQQGEGQEPAANDHDAVIAKLRKENANWRTKFRDLEGKWKEAEPVLAKIQEQEQAQKTEAQRLAEENAALKAQAEKAQAEAQRIVRESTVKVWATEIGVDPTIIPLLDLTKLDLEDEKATKATLGKLAAARQPGGASNPGRGGNAAKSDDELRAEIFGGRRRSSLFGG